jgi:hypothetical protein
MDSIKVYHYTVCKHLAKIINDGFIKLATAGVPKWEKPAVFCTLNEKWDNICNKLYYDSIKGKLIPTTFERTYEIGGGVARIQVNPEIVPYNVYEYKRLSGMKKGDWDKYFLAAKTVSSDISKYRIGFEPIFKNDWLNIQILDIDKQTWNDVYF